MMWAVVWSAREFKGQSVEVGAKRAMEDLGGKVYERSNWNVSKGIF
jgi:hypothetical protein